ncbi:MAG: prepilin peptidase [Robiginitomaculum sp.]
MIASLLILVVFAGCQFAASWSDVSSMKIPNWISLVLVAGFLLITPLVWQGWAIFGEHVLIGVVIFFIGVFGFAMGGFGGGDAKLLAATSLWWVMPDLWMYLIYTALAGGVLAIFLLIGKKFIPVKVLTTPWVYRLLKDEKKMPYGLALAFGALMTLPSSDIFQYVINLT